MASVFGTSASEIIDALDGVTSGADVVFGYGGDDTLYGLGGNDLIKGGGGADTLNGGAGLDTAEYSDSAQAVIVSLQSGQGSGGTAEGDTLVGIENLTGSAYADILTGDNGVNVLAGGADADTLKGAGGADTLNGDSGNDVLKGGGGADILNGGAGIDTASYEDSYTSVTVSLASGTGAGGDAAGDQLISVENLSGSDFYDTLTGNGDGNVLRGNGGSDILYGEGGSDTLYGDGGNDMLWGGSGADTMIGGEGSDTFYVENAGDVVIETSSGTFDSLMATVSYTLAAGAKIEHLSVYDWTTTDSVALTGNEWFQTLMGNNGVNALYGGAGNDELWGYGGDDAFIFNTALGVTNVDAIVDYSLNDLVALDDAIFSGLSTTGDGHLAASNFAIGTAAADADDRIVYNSATGDLFYDADGSGAGVAIQFARLSAGLALTSDEFLVI